MTPAILAAELRKLVGDLGPDCHPSDAVDIARVADRLELLAVAAERRSTGCSVASAVTRTRATLCACGNDAVIGRLCRRCDEAARARHREVVRKYEGERED